MPSFTKQHLIFPMLGRTSGNRIVCFQTQHPSQLARYSVLTTNSSKRSRKSESNTAGDGAPPTKQVRLSESDRRTVPQSTIGHLVLRFLSDGLLPFNLVALPAFRQLVTGLQPGSTVISRDTVRKRMADAVVGMKKALCNVFRTIDWVSTTTDCWSARGRSYIGVTAHWII